MNPHPTETCRFGQFELDIAAGELRRNGRRLKVQPQPFKLLLLLTRRAGTLVNREEIRNELWPDGTHVDFDQAVNFAVKQIRDVLGDSSERPLYLETVPRRGYRFIAPVETGAPLAAGPAHVELGAGTHVRLQKALWANIAELRLAEVERRRRVRIALVTAAALVAVLVLYVVITHLR
jgi:DNA-binding winged helix-turn-helix (wHTH) protein